MKKHRLLRTTIVAAAGAAAMYLADPEHGPLRRALLRQRLELLGRQAGDVVVAEPMATAAAMIDLRDTADVTAMVEPAGATFDLPSADAGPASDLPHREPIRDDTMTIDEALFHAARTS